MRMKMLRRVLMLVVIPLCAAASLMAQDADADTITAISRKTLRLLRDLLAHQRVVYLVQQSLARPVTIRSGRSVRPPTWLRFGTH